MSSSTPSASERPTAVRHLIVMATCLVAFLLYLHRFCMSYAQRYVKEDLGLSDDQLGYCFSAFFLAYAIGQVPSGWLSDRLGARSVLASYVLIWSFFTALMGATVGFGMLLLIRMAAGLGQAGAYPTSAALIKRWVPFTRRGTASSLVAFGGRVGGGLAPIITVALIVAFVPNDIDTARLSKDDILNAEEFRTGLAGEGKSNKGKPDSQETLFAIARLRERLDIDVPIGDIAPIVTSLSQSLEDRELFRPQDFAEIPIEREAKSLLAKRKTLSPAKVVRLNRLLLESLLPRGIRKLYVQGWRPVMVAYGTLGILVAGLFWFNFRERPRDHPWCNEREVALVETGSVDGHVEPESDTATTQAKLHEPPPMRAILKSRSLWLICISQWGGNVGWVFLVTWLPRYLLEEHDAPLIERGWMITTILVTGWSGMLIGGWATDYFTRRFGLRWRMLPAIIGRFIAMTAYLCCLLHPNIWTITAIFAVVAFSNDMSNPAGWAYKQDVGGRHVGSIHGWANMWGNLGATVSPILLRAVEKAYGWDAAFLTCAAAFLIAGVASLGVDARIPIVQEESA